jgi:hypothetical protein
LPRPRELERRKARRKEKMKIVRTRRVANHSGYS